MCVRLSLCLSLSLFTGLMGCWLFRFPAQIHIASSLNKDLWRQMADVSSTEARALYAFNTRLHPGLAAGGFGAPCSRSLEGCLGLSYYTPNVNIARCVHISNGERGMCVWVCGGTASFADVSTVIYSIALSAPGCPAHCANLWSTVASDPRWGRIEETPG